MFSSSLMRGVSGAIPQMERGVASRGGGSQPLAAGAPALRPLRPGGEECAGADPDVQSGEGKAPARPKIPTGEHREASVPRETPAPPPPPRHAPGRPARRAARVPQPPHVISALRHPSFRVREAKGKTRAKKMRRGNEETCAV